MTNWLKYGRRSKYYTMKTVLPIRDEKRIEARKNILKRKEFERLRFFHSMHKYRIKDQ